VRRVVIAARDPHPAAAGGLETLRAAGLEIEAGRCASSVAPILGPFLHWARTGTPYVVLKSAMTLDGKTASVTGASRWISGPVARAYVHRLRQRLGAVMVGIGTVLADDPLLTVRHVYSAAPLAAPPTRIVLDSRLRLPITSRLVRSAGEAPLIVVCTEGADEQAMGALRALGADVLSLPAREGRPDPAILMQALGARGITGILVESGGEVAFSLVETGCAHEALYFVAPRLLGGRDAPTPLGGAGYASPDAGPRLDGITVRRCGADIILRGKLAHRAPE
jgi:diaminohydroxyphosphoribosylaminopyrimidine deaminase/5-amino-6-(5-phosphoribosylamino)uracil reductase